MPTLQWQREAAETDGSLTPCYVRARVHVSHRFGRGGTAICLVRVGCVCVWRKTGRDKRVIECWRRPGASEWTVATSWKTPRARGLTRMDRVRSTHEALGVQFRLKTAPPFVPPPESAAVYGMRPTTKPRGPCVAGHWLSSSSSRSSKDVPSNFTSCHHGNPKVLPALLFLHPFRTNMHAWRFTASLTCCPAGLILLAANFSPPVFCLSLIFSRPHVHSYECEVL